MPRTITTSSYRRLLRAICDGHSTLLDLCQASKMPVSWPREAGDLLSVLLTDGAVAQIGLEHWRPTAIGYILNELWTPRA